MLWRDHEDDVQRYRCSVGHAYSAASLDGEQGRVVEGALWAAARMLGDRHTLLEEMASRADGHGHVGTAGKFREQALEAAHAADTVRQLIEAGRIPVDGNDTAA